MNMHIFDLIVFLLFTVGTVAFGYLFGRTQQSADEYTSGGGRIPGTVVGLSIFASFCSSISFLGYASSAYSGDWNAFVFTLSILPAGLVAMWYFVPFYRKLGSISAYSYLEQRFGRWARVYASAFYLFTQVCRSAAILYLLAVPMNVLMGWNIPVVITVTGLAIIIYARRGGMRSVIWTEALQGAILIIGAATCLIVVIQNLPGGLSQAYNICRNDGKLSLGSFGPSLTESTFWVCMIYGLFTNLGNFGVDQSYTQRYCAAPTLTEARKSALTGSLLPVPVNVMLFAIGSALYAFYKVYPYSLPADIKADYVFPYFIIHELPTGVIGAMLACIFCAGMSTVATSITSSATIIVTDFWGIWQERKHRHTVLATIPDEVTAENLDEYRAAREEHAAHAAHIDMKKVRALRLYSVIVGVASIGVAMAFLMVDNALDAWWALSSLCSGGVLGLFLLGIIVRRAQRPQAIIGISAGMASLVLIGLQTPLRDLFGITPFLHVNLGIVVSTMLVFLVGWLTVPLFKGTPGTAPSVPLGSASPRDDADGPVAE